MKTANQNGTSKQSWRGLVVFPIFLASATMAVAGSLIEPVSILNTPPVAAPAAGSGDSLDPVITPDGRYVLFASSADNLVLNNSANPAAAPFPPVMNIFLRDRLKQTTTLVSVSVDGSGMGDGDSIPDGISTNGEYALFESAADNLAAGDTNGVNDIFVRDLATGITTLVSVSTNGGAANGTSRSAVMTPDGRYVAFISAASNLAPGATNGIPNVFVRDLQAGTTTLASPGAAPFSTASTSDLPLITPDGRSVAFYSTATNLVAGVTNSGEIYVRNLSQGTTTWASTNSRSLLHSLGMNCALSCNQAISDNGQIVTYEACPLTGPGVILQYNLGAGLTEIINTNAAGILTGQELNERNLAVTPDGRFVAFVPDIEAVNSTTINTGVAVWDGESNTTTLASVDVNQAAVTNAIFDWPAITPDGKYVAFISDATNLTANPTTPGFHLYVRDMQAGTDTLVDADTNGFGSMSNLMTFPRITDDGSIVAFDGLDGSLAANDNNHAYDVFVRNLVAGSTELISAELSGLPSLTPNGSCFISSSSISSNGQYIAFSSDADNLAPGDTNGLRDVFVHDALNGTNILASVNTNGVPGTGLSTDPAISGDGRYVAFTSGASDLAANGTNNIAQIFLRDLQAGVTALVSVNTNGGPGDGACYSSAVSSDGRYVLFFSAADNLAPGAVGNAEGNVFWRDMQSGSTRALTTTSLNSGTSVNAAAMTPDGQRVAFDIITENGAAFYVEEAVAGTNIYSVSLSGKFIYKTAISPDGDLAVYYTTNQVVFVNLTNDAQVVFTNGICRAACQFSADSRLAAFVAGTNQIYRYDFAAGTNLVVSAAANGYCDSPTISGDGRFIAYRSNATNLAPNATNGVPNIFLYDSMSGTTTLVSASPIGDAPADGRSSNPVFSGDGQTLIWQSWANDLAGQDFNQWCNLYALRAFATNAAGGGTGQPFGISSFGFSSLAGLGSSANASTLGWPAAAGATYEVQFTTNLDNPQWQPVTNAITIIGAEGYLLDPAPNSNQRFYRVVETF